MIELRHGYKTIALAGLKPWERNARTHSAEQVAQIAASIREFGFTNPVLIDEDGRIIAGHGRVAAAKSLSLTDVPAIELRGLSPAQKRALVIADNQLAMNAGWDEDLLSSELAGLKDEGFDLSVVGFSAGDLDRLLAQNTDADPEVTPELPANPVTSTGDLWLLGKHRVLCADCTGRINVAQVLAGLKPHLMVTDPPYGVEYDPKWRARAGVNRNREKLGEVENDDRADWREAWALFPGDVAYVWHADRHAAEVQASLEAAGFEIRCQVVWAKDRFALGRGHYHWQHEPCWYAVRKGGNGHWAGDRSQSTLWSIPAREGDGLGHSTQKPVDCMRRPIENNSSPGHAVYEPFLGSGTTLIAAQMTGRQCLALEISAAYVDVAVLRWQQFTGQEATLEGDGRTFNQVKDERHGANGSS